MKFTGQNKVKVTAIRNIANDGNPFTLVDAIDLSTYEKVTLFAGREFVRPVILPCDGILELEVSEYKGRSGMQLSAINKSV